MPCSIVEPAMVISQADQAGHGPRIVSLLIDHRSSYGPIAKPHLFHLSLLRFTIRLALRFVLEWAEGC